ncbi:MAG TPA: hypothetical protein P5222_08695 [Candidatus Cloacimonadota bacterium]|nr:hypothetical protein [Candidatus Cloacimonadota bacterium]HOR58620.1 hypothetical protein [Candidatus Cloacimonadota bacterium]HRS50761.1 hypothetical protein [Candidatus Cloacimonadota bacterium]
MKEKSVNKNKAVSEKEAVITFIVETEQRKEKEFRESIARQLAPVAGKRIILNSK